MKNVFILMLFILFLFPSQSFSRLLNEHITKTSTADHKKFKELQKDFKTAEEVIQVCLKCHNLAAHQLQNTIHWTWEVEFDGRKLGKKNVLNNF